MRQRAGWLIAFLAVAGCGTKDGAGPGPLGGPSLKIVAGATATDTIDAVLTQGLVVEATGADGRPRSGLVVRFNAPPVESGTAQGVVLAFGTGSFFSSSLADTTDARGRILVIVRMGFRVSSPVVIATLPEFGLADTAHFTIHPGLSDRLFFTTADTLLGIGKTRTVATETRDRRGNATSDPVVFTALTSVCSVSGAIVTTTAVGRCLVEASSGAQHATSTISVAPSWDIAAVRTFTFPYPITRLNLETGASIGIGTTESANSDVRLRPSGLMLYTSQSAIGVRQPSGQVGLPFISELPWNYQESPRFGPQDQSVYFVGSTVETGIFKVSIAGTGVLPVRRIDGVNSIDVSPDGSKIVCDIMGELVVISSSGATMTPLNQRGVWPRWSPDGDRIAFVLGGGVFSVLPDGSQLQRVSDQGLFNIGGPVDWSPDGQWLVVVQGTVTLLKADGTDYVQFPFSSPYNTMFSATFVR